MIFHKKTLLLNKQKVHIKDQMKIRHVALNEMGELCFELLKKTASAQDPSSPLRSINDLRRNTFG